MAAAADDEIMDEFLWDNLSSATPTNSGGRATNGLPPVSNWKAIISFVHLLICVGGILGNSCVIVVIARYAKTKTVTNLYIANLAVADLCFLVGLPILVTTSLLERWVFGAVVCRLFLVSTSINWFASVFVLTVMSVDRYMAVCWPVASLRYRTLNIARIVCACVWAASMLAMLPMMLYATTAERPGSGGRQTCTIQWPLGGLISPEIAFIWYGFLLAFAAPVAVISVFYALVVVRLRRLAANRINQSRKSSTLAKSHARVTALVLTVIAVYVCCWLPYWIFQVTLTLITSRPARWIVQAVSHIVTMLSYANSMLNPLLYAAFNEQFRVGFSRACRCLTGRCASDDFAAGKATSARSQTRRDSAERIQLAPVRQSDYRRAVASGKQTEVVEVMAVSCVAEETAMAEDKAIPTAGEGGDLVQTCGYTTAVVVSNCAVSSADVALEETLM